MAQSAPGRVDEAESVMRAVVAWCCLAVGSVIVLTSIVQMTITGWFLLGVVLLVVWAWGLHVFRRDFWAQDVELTEQERLLWLARDRERQL